MAIRKYGAAYQGSKSKIADEIILLKKFGKKKLSTLAAATRTRKGAWKDFIT